MAGDFTVRSARPEDVGTVLELITDLARFEHLEDTVQCRQEDLHEALFGPKAVLSALLAFRGTRAVGLATHYCSYATFRGHKILYLEDLYVVEGARGTGVGQGLMACLAKCAQDKGCGGLRWLVLDWNAEAIRFYTALGAKCDPAWNPYGLSGNALDRLARQASRYF
jgi:GNAT superfamily N-acetyltransferase